MSTRCIVSISHLSKSFAEHKVLNNINFDIDEGETVVILGRSGTGKSVTLKAIIGLIEPSQGNIRVFGKNIHAMSEQERLAFRKNIGYVFQNAALFDSLSVLENVGFTLFQEKKHSASEIRQLVTERLKMVGLAHAIDQYPSELSGGMRKRVGLARALINLPRLILYDEPTSGLDPLTTDVINQIILRLHSQLKVTSVVVTHDMKSAFTIADRIIMLDQGRIIIEGTPQEIQSSENPWVQHFVSGHALETERIDTSIFPAINTGTIRRTTNITTAGKSSARLQSIGSSSHERNQVSGLLPAVRNRRKTTRSSSNESFSENSNESTHATLPTTTSGSTSKTYPADEWMPEIGPIEESESRDSHDTNNDTHK